MQRVWFVLHNNQRQLVTITPARVDQDLVATQIHEAFPGKTLMSTLVPDYPTALNPATLTLQEIA